MTKGEFHYRECLMTFCNSCRFSYQILAEGAFRIAFYKEIAEILPFCDKDEGIVFDNGLLENVDHFKVKHLVKVMKALENTRNSIININSLDKDKLGVDYEEGVNAGFWSYWEERTINSEQEIDDQVYIFIHAILFNCNALAMMLSKGMIDVELSNFEEFEAINRKVFDESDQNVQLMLDMFEEIQEPFLAYHDDLDENCGDDYNRNNEGDCEWVLGGE